MTHSRRFIRTLAVCLGLICAGTAQAQVTSRGLVPDGGDGTVHVIDTASFGLAFPSAITVGGHPVCSYQTRDGRFGYVTTGWGSQVVKINMATGTVVSAISVGAYLSCIAVTPDEQTAYVTDLSLNMVHVVDLTTGAYTSISVGFVPQGLDITPDGSKVYVANTNSDSVSVISTATNAVAATLSVGFKPIAVHVLRDGSTVFVANYNGNTLTPITVATDTVLTAIPVDAQPTAIDESPDGQFLYVACDSASTVDVVILSGPAVGWSFLGSNITGVSVTNDGRQIWALDSFSNLARVLVTPALTLVANVSVGAMPSSLRPFIGPNLIVPAGGTPLVIGSDADLTSGGFGTSYVDFHGGTLQLAGDWTSSRTVSLLAGSPSVIDTNGHTATLSGGIKGEGALQILGGGRVVFSSIASHPQTEVMENTTFEVNNLHTPDLFVDGTLAGSGTVGNVTLICFSSLSPGSASSTGILTATGHVAFGPFSTFNVRLNGDMAGIGYDQLVATGGADLNGATLSATLGYTPTPGIAWTLATNVTGTFNGLPEGSLFTISGQPFRITYQGGAHGTDVMIMRDEAPVLGTINDVTVPGSMPPVAQHVTFTASNDFGPMGIVATSSNQTLVPSVFTVSHICTTYTLDFMPAAQQAGTTTITLTALDGAGNTTVRTFHFTITDAAPMLQPIANQSIGTGSVLGPLTLTVNDDLTPVLTMGLTATSSNQAVLTDSNIAISSGTTRTLTATPATHVAGQTTITVTATDNGGHSAQQSFLLTVTDRPPVIGGLGDQTIGGGNVLGPINFTLSDDLTPVDALTVSATSSNSALLTNADIVLGGSGAARTLTATPVFGGSGSTQITVSASDGTNTATSTFTLTVTDTPLYFLAEGATGGFFDTDILIANPNSAAAPVTLTFYKSDGSTIVQQRTLAATSRTTIHAKDIAGLEATSFATAVASTGNLPLVVERTMTWDATGYGSSGEKASSGAATKWYFAEGSQGYFHTYFLLLNPHPAANVAHVSYLLDDGSSVDRDYALAATSRTTVDLGDEPALANRSFGATITFDLPGMAERAMYFGDAPVFSGGHDSAGVTAPATSWFLAEGATGTFFDTFVLVANPLDNPANVTMTYLPAAGVPVSKQHTLAPHQRLTVNIAMEDPSLASAAVATSVASDGPVIVERSQYWPQGNWYEAHNSAGETSAATKWGLAEGRVGGTNHAQTYILIANAGAQPADVTATFLRTDGTTIVKTLMIPAMSRVNIAVTGAGSDVPELADEAFGTVIASTQPVIVERSMYADANGVTWAAGTNATASRLP